MNIESVRLALSDRCNLAHKHDKCPASLVTEHHDMSTETVMTCLDGLKEIRYTGEVGFHLYNEPTLDPRLSSICAIAISYGMKPLVWTNGTGDISSLPQGTEIYRTAYDGTGNIPINFDDRLKIYEKPYKERTRKCTRGPICQVTVSPEGDVLLCCMDWKRTKTFGNVNQRPLKDILEDPETIAVQKSIDSGNSIIDVCHRC